MLSLRFGKIGAFDDETVFAHCCLGFYSVGRPPITLPPYLFTAKQKIKSVPSLNEHGFNGGMN